MSNFTQVLSEIAQGDPTAAAQLLPLVYAELRKLAAAKLARERPDQTLQATALVHEAYLRLAGTQQIQQWDSRGHFFAAVAEAMRRILVENARHKSRQKHGGHMTRNELTDCGPASTVSDQQLLSIHEALDRFAEVDPQAAYLVNLRFFAGFSLSEAAEIVGISRTTAYEQWAYARAWLRSEIEDRD